MCKVSCQEAVQNFTQNTFMCASSREVLNEANPKADLILQQAQKTQIIKKTNQPTLAVLI